MNDTIAAIATPQGEGGIHVLRISGPQSRKLAAGLFRGGTDLMSAAPRQVQHGEIRDPATAACVDRVLATWFQAPASYTGEDVIEIGAHGGPYVAGRILKLILAAGARLAEPGEFTRRAFLNGKIDLTQAEAVADVIHAASEKALQSALSQLKGRLSQSIHALYEKLLAVLAQLEAAIDFPEEGLTFQKKETTQKEIEAVRNDIQTLLATFERGKIEREGARVALIGKPNVGKSSLLNLLLGEERAIVTPHPGTTRDTLEERVRIKDIHINIVDAAGLRRHPQAIEGEGIERALKALKQADLALVVFDASEPLDDDDRLLIAKVNAKPRRLILNKCDLPHKLDLDALNAALPGDAGLLRLSAKTGDGLDALIDAVHDAVRPSGGGAEAAVLTRERHRQCLKDAAQALERAAGSIESGLSEEFVAVDVQAAQERIGSLLGKTFDEDLLDQIFGEFCIGK